MNNYELCEWFIQTLSGDVNSTMDWRCIHDQRKDLPAHNHRGTLAEMWSTLQKYNDEGYGIFCNINAMDGAGRELANVQHVRAHVADLDNLVTAQANYERAVADGACFAVQSSPGKYHVYWKVEPYVGNDFYTMIQRKLVQLYDGDKQVIDATRVMRVPGFLHQKGEPYLVTGHTLPSVNVVRSSAQMEADLAHVSVFDHIGSRSLLGEPSMEAPTLDWLRFALSLTDPNEMDRGEWLSMSAAIKQSGWNLTDEETLHGIWSEWCDRYDENDPGENRKLWDSIKDTEVGWTSIERRSTVKAYMTFGFKDAPQPRAPEPTLTAAEAIKTQQNPRASTDGTESLDGVEMLSEYECKQYFEDCYFVASEGKIFNRGRFMKSGQFNGYYGGKQFIITSTGKATDEPWKAATRSTLWTIPKVDHVRFLPDKPSFEIVNDGLGRPGLNTYMPAIIDSKEGDVSMWLDHVKRILPDENDRNILMSYMAHCVKYPGFKIPWAPMLQSAEGIGKSVFFEVMQYALGDMYIYSPKAPELVKSGSTFNAWMRGKLMIMVNEIKVDERRELIEILKPMISDNRVEIQSKGVDQEMEDNPANWFFFSNFRDAVPITVNGRRYSIFYSCLQTAADITAAGMDDDYFNRLFKWLREDDGFKHIAHWLLTYPIERGALPMRAPKTSSHSEALSRSRSPMEVVVTQCIEDGVSGFRGGYISTLAVIARCKGSGIRTPGTRIVQNCLEGMGYIHLGRAPRAYMQEDINSRTEVYGQLSTLDVGQYGAVQGYE